MKHIGILLVVMSIALLGLVSAVSMSSESGGSGAIWTTKDDCGDEQQDVNEYDIGDAVYINGDNFDEGDYDWSITGQPGGASCDPGIVVANGIYPVDETGAFCFEAYTVQEGDCGVYKARFSNKQDAYHIIPEFGIVIGALTALSAIGIFFFVRRK